MGKQAPPFQYLNDAQAGDLLRGQFVQPLAVILNTASRHRAIITQQQAGNSLEGRAFTGAIGPQQGHNAARLDLERDGTQDENDVAVNDFNITDG